ncbi:PilZ domain-containing protein [Brevundimonas sp.]|uniref:PilZ domain-containing protein n=1 Tax=Brevundimonas sp. TaxID=1871086 RepID=UPI00343DB0E9
MRTRSPSAEPGADRRTVQRDRCVLRCQIIHGPWNEVANAIIRDLHEDGARLRLMVRVALTGRLRLQVQPSGALHLADIVWQRGDEVGVRLIATLDDPVERQIEELRRAAAALRQSRRGISDDGY